MSTLQNRNPDNAAEIYRKMIVRVRQLVQDKVRVVYDPVTYIQKGFLDGKLIFVKNLTPTGVMFDKTKEQGELKGHNL